MPVDRLVSGIRVSGRTENRRRTARFPTQIPSKMNHRRPAHRPAHEAVVIGRVRAQRYEAEAQLPASAGIRSHRDGRGRSTRALVAGLLLAAVTIVGAGVAAMALGSTPAPVPGISGGGAPASPGTPIRSSVADGSGRLPATISAAQPGTDPASLPVNSIPNPAASASTPVGNDRVDPPATVSMLAPGDPGFGWPSSAFGEAG